jgi:septal ring factor EnvC (AmiA/AmiB activator)
MSDDTKAVEAAEPKVDTQVQDAAQAELKKVIAERDKAKAKLREREEEDRKAAEAKAIEEGKLKELLTARDTELAELKKYRESVEADRMAQKARALDKVPEAYKKFADKMSDAVEINEFLETLNAGKLTTHTSKSPTTAPEKPKYKTHREWQESFDTAGGLIPKL